MNIQNLKLFLDIINTHSFIRTAEKNHMSASTLSRHIQRMEEEIGQPLLLRDNRQVILTEAGRKFLSFAEQTWLSWQQIQQELSQKQNELEGELKLFCSVTAAYSHLPKILERFRQRYPKVEIKLSTGDPAKALNTVQSLKSDLALAGKPEFLPHNIAFQFIDDISLSLVVPKITCLATKLLKYSPIDWQHIPFILPVEGPARQRIEHWFKLQKIRKPQIYATVEGHEAILSMVAVGCGVAMLPDVVVQHSAVSDQVSFFLPDIAIKPFELGVCVQHRRLKEPIIQAFWKLLSALD
uniref:HTH-type transcriptional activator IlvY n=1 Tax=Otariodibacter sp. TaxID=3030919 RepID=UPI002605EB8E|nr:HTH-type transcriptional activator IlvY [Otariodibacter sp.]